jgi:ribonuclease PH
MFLSGVLRQRKSLSGCQRYFSLKNLTQRWAAQCVKPITRVGNKAMRGGGRDSCTFGTSRHFTGIKSSSHKFQLHLKLLPMQRTDGRGPDEIRSLNFELNVAPHASGSVLVSMGQTRVICGVTIEEAVPRWMKEQGVTGGWLTAEYSMLPYSTQTRKPRDVAKGRLDGRSVEIQRLIGRSLRAVVDLEKLGPRTVWVDCDVLQADGGTRTTAITGASLALAIACRKLVREKKLDAPPIQKLVAAVSAGILDGQAVLDLNYEEDKLVTVDFNLVATEDGEFVEVQGSGEEATFANSQLDEMLALARKGIAALIGAQRAVLARIMVSPPEP